MSKTTSIDISIVIPVFNSGDCLLQLRDKIIDVFTTQLSQKKYEILFVNDGSDDTTTQQILKNISSPDITVYNLSANIGKTKSLLTGFYYAKGDVIITMDDDLQHDPCYIPQLLEQLTTSDVAIAQFGHKNRPFSNVISSWLKNYIDKHFIKKPLGVTNSPYKALKKEVVEKILSYENGHPHIAKMLYQTKAKIRNIKIPLQPPALPSRFGTKGRLKHYQYIFSENLTLQFRWLYAIGRLMINFTFCLTGLFGIILFVFHWHFKYDLTVFSILGLSALFITITGWVGSKFTKEPIIPFDPKKMTL